MNQNGIIKTIGSFVDKRSPEILLGVGIAGMLTTVTLSVMSTPKAIRAIENKKNDLKKEKLNFKEVLVSCWKYYIPSALTCFASVACLIGSNTIHNKRQAALATACALSESALRKYTEKVIETVGEKKEKEIRDKVSEDEILEHPLSKSKIFPGTGGSVLCYDDMSGRYFMSDKTRIEKAVNIINYRLRSEMYVPLNDFYEEINLPEIGCGDLLGFDIEKEYFDPKWSTQLADNGTPVLVMMYKDQVVAKHGCR